jgi:hypothetical protein
MTKTTAHATSIRPELTMAELQRVGGGVMPIEVRELAISCDVTPGLIVPVKIKHGV